MVGNLSEEQIQQLLQRNIIGRIGCYDGEKMYVVPVSYYFNGSSVIAHSKIGLKIHIMRRNPDVCFEVDEMKSFTNWQSVIAWGRYEEITDEKQKHELMEAFVHRMLRLKVSETAYPSETSSFHFHPRTGKMSTIVYRIVLHSITGRFETDTQDGEDVRNSPSSAGNG